MMKRPALPPDNPKQNAATARLLAAFGQGIKDARLRAGMTQAGLAEQCGLRQHEVSRIEHGQLTVTLGTIASLAEVFDGEVWAAVQAARVSSGWARPAPVGKQDASSEQMVPHQ